MTKDEILSRLLSDISDEFDKSVGSFFYDVTKPASEEFEAAYVRLEEILKKQGILNVNACIRSHRTILSSLLLRIKKSVKAERLMLRLFAIQSAL